LLRRQWLLLALAILILPPFLHGCSFSRSTAAPTQNREKASYVPDYHTVRKGDTLYSIAWRYNADYRELARRNGIRKPYTIYIGQKISIKNKAVSKPSRKSGNKHAKKRSEKIEATSQKQKKRSKPSTSKSRSLHWGWPVTGRIISTFSNNDPSRKGVDIAGKAGTPILAASDGEIVYSGSGLVGLGMLIIVKHDDHYLSAYGHNRKLLVNEGTKVKRGQRIAEMGKTGTDKTMLHFQIRYDGKPVDPLRYLPKRRR
jgi:lipoprotein NlpD